MARHCPVIKLNVRVEILDAAEFQGKFILFVHDCIDLINELVHCGPNLTHVDAILLTETSQLQLFNTLLDFADLALLQRQLLLQLKLKTLQFRQDLHALRAKSAIAPRTTHVGVMVLSRSLDFFVIRDKQLDFMQAFSQLSQTNLVPVPFPSLALLYLIYPSRKQLDWLLKLPYFRLKPGCTYIKWGFYKLHLLLNGAKKFLMGVNCRICSQYEGLYLILLLLAVNAMLSNCLPYFLQSNLIYFTLFDKFFELDLVLNGALCAILDGLQIACFGLFYGLQALVKTFHHLPLKIVDLIAVKGQFCHLVIQ